MARVLIVDDEPDLLEFLREELTSIGHQADLASRAREAIAKAQATPPDMVLLDLHMPEMDGIDALKRLRANNPGLPVFLMTAVRDPEVLAQAASLGARGVLSKPVEIKALLALLPKVLDNPPT
ncbi:MAG: response regulator [Nitrospinota bacterium]